MHRGWKAGGGCHHHLRSCAACPRRWGAWERIFRHAGSPVVQTRLSGKKERIRMSIHPTAIVAEGAVIPASCQVGPYCTVGPNVVLGENCELVSHVVLDGHTTFGSGNR